VTRRKIHTALTRKCPDVETLLPTTGEETHIKGGNASDLLQGSYTRRQKQAFVCRAG
jgi:hypothetical protein